MVEIEVKGIPCLFNEDALNDFEMLECLADMNEGNILALVKLAKGIFGSEQLDNIKTQLRDEAGICRLDAISEFVNESIIAAAAARKADPKN